MKNGLVQHIVSNSLSKIISGAVSLALVIIGARTLGKEGMGEVSLVVLAVTISQLLSGLFSGGSVVYMSVRYPAAVVFWMATLWGIVSNVLLILLLWLLGLFSPEYLSEAMVLGVLISCGQAGMSIILGKEKIIFGSILGVVQSFVQLGLILTGFYGLNLVSVEYFLLALSVFHCIPWIACLVTYAKEIFRIYPMAEVRPFIRESLKQSGFAQAGSATQLFNYRLSYYFIEFLQGTAALGLFSVSVQITEGVLMIARSLATVLYAKVVNYKEEEKKRMLTSALFKLSVVATLLFFLVALLIPVSWYITLLGDEFTSVKQVLMTLSAGIVFLSGTTVLSAYFSGTGKPWVNTISSVGGLLVTLACGYVLVFFLGVTGGALVMVASYLVSYGISQYYFIRQSKRSFASLLYDKNEIRVLRGFFRKP